MPATYLGTVTVEADSESDAARLALEADWCEFDWDCSDSGDRHSIEVLDVQCEEPPEGAVFMDPSRSKATIEPLFEPEAQIDA